MKNGFGKGTFSGSASYMVHPRLMNVSAGYVDEEIVTLRRMAKDGATLEAMSQAIGKSTGVTRRIILANQIVWNKPVNANPLGAAHRTPDGWKDKAIQMRRAGSAISDIADAVGVTAPTVAIFLKEAGVPDPHLPRGPKVAVRKEKPVSARERKRRCDEAIRKPTPIQSETA